MSTKNELSRITLDIPKIDHRKLKSLAANLGVSMREIILESIQERLAKKVEEGECPYSHEPNEETIKAIKNARQRKGLVKSKSVDDLFKKLGY